MSANGSGAITELNGGWGVYPSIRIHSLPPCVGPRGERCRKGTATEPTRIKKARSLRGTRKTGLKRRD